MERFYAGLGVIYGILGVGAITDAGRHGSSAVTSGIILLVGAASTVYAVRGAARERVA